MGLLNNGLFSIVLYAKKRIDPYVCILRIVPVSLPAKKSSMVFSIQMGKDDFGVDESIKRNGTKGCYLGKARDKIHVSSKSRKFLIIVLPWSVKKDSG